MTMTLFPVPARVGVDGEYQECDRDDGLDEHVRVGDCEVRVMLLQGHADDAHRARDDENGT